MRLPLSTGGGLAMVLTQGERFGCGVAALQPNLPAGWRCCNTSAPDPNSLQGPHLLVVLVLVNVKAPRAAARVDEADGRRLLQAPQAVLAQVVQGAGRARRGRLGVGLGSVFRPTCQRPPSTHAQPRFRHRRFVHFAPSASCLVRPLPHTQPPTRACRLKHWEPHDASRNGMKGANAASGA